MKIGSVLENQKIEKRISITPEIAKKYKSLGLDVYLSKNYGVHLGISDEEYKNIGVKFLDDEKEIINLSNIVVQLGLLSDDKSSLLKEDQTLIGVLNPYDNKKKLDELTNKKIKLFSLELLPRITRAQSMDILSSQANLAGYKAVIESFANFEKAIPMMMTAAGTVPAAKILVVGAGVAGLQAIATAKRMGGIVFATDVRMASKEQVESLGGKFLTVEGAENLETEGGYAKEASDDFKKKQEELLSETLKKIDIVICTALIPGKKAPLIIKEDMINKMQAGSVIYDLAAIQGGNTAFTKVDEIIEQNGVKIMGETNILNRLPVSASSLYAKNMFNFVENLFDKENKKLNINLEDEIIEKTLIKWNMEIDPLIFRLSIFILSIFVGYYVVWSVTPSLHTPLMSVTNAISSVIIVGAIIAGLSGNPDSVFSTSSIFGFLAIALAAINIFGGFLVTQRMLAMYKKKKKDKKWYQRTYQQFFT